MRKNCSGAEYYESTYVKLIEKLFINSIQNFGHSSARILRNPRSIDAGESRGVELSIRTEIESTLITFGS
jgi:hypothetical protein